MARFFEAAAAGVCVALTLCVNQSAVSGLVLGHGQVISNDQVSDDFALALKLGRFGRKARIDPVCGLDLATDRDQSLEWYLR